MRYPLIVLVILTTAVACFFGGRQSTKWELKVVQPPPVPVQVPTHVDPIATKADLVWVETKLKAKLLEIENKYREQIDERDTLLKESIKIGKDSTEQVKFLLEYVDKLKKQLREKGFIPAPPPVKIRLA